MSTAGIMLIIAAAILLIVATINYLDVGKRAVTVWCIIIALAIIVLVAFQI